MLLIKQRCFGSDARAFGVNQWCVSIGVFLFSYVSELEGSNDAFPLENKDRVISISPRDWVQYFIILKITGS